MAEPTAPIGANAYGILDPDRNQILDLADRLGLTLDDDDVEFFLGEMEGIFGAYRRVAQLPEPHPGVKYPRSAGRRPPDAENQLGAWYWQTSITGKESGPLSGKRIALKDNICVAGVPMMSGSRLIEGLVPDADATVATRILDAGGEIAGKAVCEDHSMSAWPSAATGPVRNPRNPEYTAGGSSSGSAALVGNGDVDMAMGGDQGGSIRIPASYCGVYGMKPTWGLVPYTGILTLDNTIDHTGPIASRVEDVALLLQAVAGVDGLDPRQPPEIAVPDYSAALTGELDGLRIGVVEEGFGWADGGSEADVDEAVREAANELRTLGAAVEPISIPMHRDGVSIHLPIFIDGAVSQVFHGNGFGRHWKGYYPTGIIDYYGKAKKSSADEYSDTIKLIFLVGEYMNERYNGRLYAKAQNLGRLLTATFDEALESFDLLAMPTTPRKATPLMESPTRQEHLRGGFGAHWNTCPFNVTGHPAINVPCAMSDGLPVGMMLVGRRFEDATVLKGAHAYQTLERFAQKPGGEERESAK